MFSWVQKYKEIVKVVHEFKNIGYFSSMSAGELGELLAFLEEDAAGVAGGWAAV